MNRNKKKFLRNKVGYGVNELNYGSQEVKTAVKEYNEIQSKKVYHPEMRGVKMTMSKMILGKNPKRKNIKGAFGSVSNEFRKQQMIKRFNKQFEEKVEKMRKANEERKKHIEELERKKKELEAKKKEEPVEVKKEDVKVELQEKEVNEQKEV